MMCLCILLHVIHGTCYVCLNNLLKRLRMILFCIVHVIANTAYVTPAIDNFAWALRFIELS